MQSNQRHINQKIDTIRSMKTKKNLEQEKMNFKNTWATYKKYLKR